MDCVRILESHMKRETTGVHVMARCEPRPVAAHRAIMRSSSLCSIFLALAVRATVCASSCLARLFSSSCAKIDNAYTCMFSS